MSHLARFGAYAAAFERAAATDDWSILEEYFTDDAVYEIGMPLLGAQRAEGRSAILAWFRDVFERFDRRFATRDLAVLDGPHEDGNRVWLRGSATYTAPGAPDFVLELEERVDFDGDRIARLEDVYTPQMIADSERYARAHAERLGIRLSFDGDG